MSRNSTSDPLKARKDLHEALDLVLNDAEKNGGSIYPPVFWAFMSALARGRGISEGLEEQAALNLVAAGSAELTDPVDLYRRWQGAILNAFLSNLTDDTGGILPDSFSATAWRAVALNMQGDSGAGYIDILGLGTTSGGELKGPARVARGLLVRHIMRRAIKEGRPESAVRAETPLKELEERTWRYWKAETAKNCGLSLKELRESLAGDTQTDLTPEHIASLWRFAYNPR